MSYVYLTCPACRGRFNADGKKPFGFCPFCGRRVATKEMTDDEVRDYFIRNSIRCNKQCEKSGYKCRCGCVLEAFLDKEP